jgi:quinol monooxygenase YgiN
MVLVAGQINVESQQREAYLAGSARVVEKARGAAGCHDFAITAAWSCAWWLSAYEIPPPL